MCFLGNIAKYVFGAESYVDIDRNQSKPRQINRRGDACDQQSEFQVEPSKNRPLQNLEL